MSNICTKFEISISTQYEDMKGDANVENGLVYCMQLGVTKGHLIWQNSIERIYDFFSAFYSNNVLILHRFSGMARYMHIFNL